MSFPFDEEQLAKLKVFVELCKNQPLILHHPKLSFFKEYLIMLGVTLPPPTFDAKNFVPSGDSNTSNNNAPEKPCSDEEAEVESDVELDMEGIIDLDPIDESQVMGDDTKEVTDEERDQSDEKRSEAMQAFSEQQFDNAIKLYSEAIQLNPQSALLFAKRGQVYLKMNKPNACIKDCTKALELNCDSAAAYKFRGRAHRLIGKWEEASHDLCESLKIDYDDQTNEWLNEVKPNAEKLRQHKLGVQRKKEEKEHRDKLRRARASREQPAAAPAGAGGAADFSNLFDQDIMAAFQDPEIAVAFADVTSNPANFIKYQNNPKFVQAIEKLRGKLGKSGSFPGFGGTGGPGSAKPPAEQDDLD